MIVLKQLCTKTVIEYRYDNEGEAKVHEKLMKSQGWNVESRHNYFINNFISYSKRHREGAFL